MTNKMKQITLGSGLMAAAYFISRFLGLLRESFIAHKFGATGLTDVYQLSFTIPEILNYMVAGGAFSIVLIPMISKYVTNSTPPQLDKRGKEIFAAIFTPFALLITLLTIITIIITPWITAIAFPSVAKNHAKFLHVVRLTRIILPAQVFFMVGGLINATLRAREDFRGNVWGPNIYNIGIILGGLCLGSLIGIESLSIGVLIGAFVGPFLICYLLAGKTIDYSLTFDFKSPEFKEYIKLTLPLMIGVSLLTVDQLFTRIFGAGSGISEGTITCLNYSRTLMLVPIGLVGQAAGQVSLTYLSHLWQQGKIKEFSTTLSHTMRGVIFLSFIFAGGIFLLAQPLISILFLRGKMTLENSHNTALLLRYMIFAVPPFAALQILMNGYYSKKNTLRPMVISTICTIFSAFIYYILSVKMKGPGIAFASMTCFWLIFLVTLVDYIYRYGDDEDFMFGPFIITTIKAIAATLFGVILTILLFENPGAIHFNPDKKLSASLLIILGGTFYMTTVFISSLLMGGDEADIMKRIMKKIKDKCLRRVRTLL